jgi:hypothetical protein
MCDLPDPVPGQPGSLGDAYPPDGLSLDDATVTADVLDDRYDLADRWPEWRLLLQTRIWVTSDKQIDHLDRLTDWDIHCLAVNLRSLAPVLAQQAALDEDHCLSSGLAWVYWLLDARTVRDLHPLVWLDTTPLMRHLNARLDPPVRAADRPGHPDAGEPGSRADGDRS